MYRNVWVRDGTWWQALGVPAAPPLAQTVPAVTHFCNTAPHLKCMMMRRIDKCQFSCLLWSHQVVFCFLWQALQSDAWRHAASPAAISSRAPAGGEASWRISTEGDIQRALFSSLNDSCFCQNVSWKRFPTPLRLELRSRLCRIIHYVGAADDYCLINFNKNVRIIIRFIIH